MTMNNSGSLLYSLDGDKSRDEILLQPYNYMTRVPEPNTTNQLCRAFNHWLKVPEKKFQEIDHIVFTLFSAYFILDDIQDNSPSRRGIPSAHLIYGVGSTLNSCCYAAYIALNKAFELGHPDAPRVIVESLVETHRGQGMDIYWRDNHICPTEEEYMEISEKKTVFYTNIMRLLQLFSENKKDHTKLSAMLGTYMQIHNDYESLSVTQYMDLKGYGEDITEGKFSYPLMHAVHKYPDDKRVIEIVKKKTTDNEVKKYCISLLEEFGSFEYTRKKLVDLANEIREEMKEFGDNPYIEELLTWTQSKF